MRLIDRRLTSAFVFQRQLLPGPVGAEEGSAAGGRARDTDIHVDFRLGHRRQREHVHSDRAEQAHAHGHQLLSVQPRRVRPPVAVVRVTAGDLPDMVQVTLPPSFRAQAK